MSIIPTTIILASLAQAPTGGLDEAISISECNFSSESDRNYDGWPDGWSRKGGLVHLKEMTNLQRLDLMGTQITGTGLVYLKKLTNLQELDLGGTQITDL